MKKLLRSDALKNFGSSAAAILIGLLIGAAVIFISNSNETLDDLRTLFAGPVEDGILGTGRVLYYAVPIIMTGLSVGFASKTGLFNIGTSGQFIIGAPAAVYVGVKWTPLPDNIHWLVAILAALAAGGPQAAIPGVMRVYLNMNEIISSIVMNYIDMYLINYSVSLVLSNALRNQSLLVAPTAVIPKAGSDKIFTGSLVSGGFVIATLFVVLIYAILNKTSFGYEMKACGFNKDASRYAGTNEKRNIILSMITAGAFMGAGDGLPYLSGSGKLIEVADMLPTEGFSGIPVTPLGLSNPIGVLSAGLSITYLNVGGNAVQQFGFTPQIVDIIISYIVYCSALSLTIKVWLSKRRRIKKLGVAEKESE